MPALASLPAFAQAVADFPAGDLEVAMEPAARAAAERSVAESGFLPLGEVHGVRENPLIIGTLLQALGLTSLTLELTLMDGITGADWSWPQRDEAMAGRVLAVAAPGSRTLVVAGNAHTPVHRTELGVPLGAVLAARRPGVREIRIDYLSGRYYNLAPRRFRPRTGARRPSPSLVLRNENLTLELPSATEAVVPQRPWPQVSP